MKTTRAQIITESKERVVRKKAFRMVPITEPAKGKNSLRKIQKCVSHLIEIH